MSVAWGVALVSMMVSLIFSELLSLPPCSLCWFQRIFMYPLVFIIPVGILIRDVRVGYYALVLSLIGWIIALYHNLIYYEIINEGFKVCTAELSCKAKQLQVFGFLSIPTMSLMAFTLILILSFRSLKNETK